MIESTYTAPPRVASLQRLALVVGVAGLALCAVGFAGNRAHFFKAYLLAYVFWIGIALGSLAISMLHHLSGGAWGVVIRRVLEAASRTLPFMALLFLPIAFGVHELYLWANPEAVAKDAILQHKAAYLNVPFFIIRAAIYFVIWSALAYLLSKWSLEQEQRGETGQALRMQRLSGLGLVLYALTILFMSVDWIMSLDPHWFSTIYGILFMGGQGLSAFAFAIAVAVLLSRTEPMSRVIAPAHLHDLGKLMLAFVMLWAYFSFSQFLIIWSANLPEEIPWYLRRWGGGWQWVGLLLIFGHFVLPFVLLLSSDIKKSGRTLIGVAVTIILMRIVDLFWNIGPLHHEESFGATWLDAVAPVALGGIWLAIFLWQLRTRPLLPLGEPYLAEALEHGRHGH
ncbi:MAG TPA: hypothetical protein VHH91_04285 [Vicinamibacterales bacterium]|nr:hypothetical protein [Vicinamibacterales bacterium]